MLGEVVWRVRLSSPLDVLRRRNQHPSIWSEPPSDEGRVAEICIANRHIEGAFDEIDNAVGDAQIDGEIGISAEEVGQARHDMHACERGWSRYPQHAARHGLLPTERGSGGFCCENNVLCMRQKGEAVFGQGRLPRRSMQKPGSEPLLQRR